MFYLESGVVICDVLAVLFGFVLLWCVGWFLLVIGGFLQWDVEWVFHFIFFFLWGLVSCGVLVRCLGGVVGSWMGVSRLVLSCTSS